MKIPLSRLRGGGVDLLEHDRPESTWTLREQAVVLTGYLLTGDRHSSRLREYYPNRRQAFDICVLSQHGRTVIGNDRDSASVPLSSAQAPR
jgi:hypothetical protein